MRTREEAEATQRFSARYREDKVAAGLAAEREAVGTDYGANGFTSRAEADRLLDRLALGTSDWLLDIGSGCGWPGLYFAARTGCRVVLSDLTAPGMRHGLARARRDGMAGRSAAVVASARHLPFRPEAFDVITHADVLC
jgi:2-polyprenyl-3-methyl-5-hydroxy-6-metoxy-1,4-benzoquinol methylase